MIKRKLKIQGAYLIKLNNKKDSRGSFSRIYCKNNFKKIGVETKIFQINISTTLKKGTVRGFHYQTKKFSEVKRVMVLQGKICDILIDTRKNSKTFGKKCIINLSDKKKEILHIPKGVSHAFQSLVDNTKIIYINDNIYNKKFEKGFNVNSKNLRVSWPLKIKNQSKKDRSLKDWALHL